MRNTISKFAHRLEELEKKVDLVLNTVQVTIQFNNPADPNVGKSTTIPLGALYAELKRADRLGLLREKENEEILDEIAGDRSDSGEDQSVGVDAQPTSPDSGSSLAPSSGPTVSESGIIITG